MILLLLAQSLHVVAALFWAGTSFLVAQQAGEGAEKLYRPQMAAAVVAVLSGAYLWARLHPQRFGGTEMILAFGAACALAAAGVQGALVGGTLRRLRGGALDETAARPRIGRAYRLATGLLAIALLCMIMALYL
jgi:hypothetical protein